MSEYIERCLVCSGEHVISQMFDSAFTCEIDGRDMTVWNGDGCIAVFPISYCPNCGAKIDGGNDDGE